MRTNLIFATLSQIYLSQWRYFRAVCGESALGPKFQYPLLLRAPDIYLLLLAVVGV